MAASASASAPVPAPATNTSKLSPENVLQLYSAGTGVWVPDDALGWTEAVVESAARNGDAIEIKLAGIGGEQQKQQQRVVSAPCTDACAASLPPLKNPPVLEGVEDLTSLSYLHEPAVLHNIKVRYSRKNIYTYSGIVLIAMNPFQRVTLYAPELVRAYSGKKRGDLEPHLFAVAEDAFRGMIRERKNQSIIVSGESGAGKTVSAKYIMRYFATADVDELEMSIGATDANNDAGNASAEVEKQVMATNPIMESFGNAKTTRNDNSSRFGKYIELLFNDKAKIAGARIRTYLLERSRVTFQPEFERNYHVFYQLCAGAPAAERKELGLGPAMSFHYLKQGGGTGTINGVDDVAEFELTQRALSTIGISVQTQWMIFRLLAAVLHIGNMPFTGDRASKAFIDTSNEAFNNVVRLLGVPAGQMQDALTKKVIVTRNEKIVSQLTNAQALIARDSIAKFIYSGLFEWLMVHVNGSLGQEQVVSRCKNFIGVLDIYGFEHFKKNSFEQFCINYANEKLQQEFNQHVFKLEQEEYVREKISWSFIEFNDNQQCIQLIEGKIGILSLLDEESRLPSGTDKSLSTKLYDNFDKKNDYFMKPRFSTTSFIVKHFAYAVEYDSEGFLEKNKDTVPDEILEMFNAAEFKFLGEIVKAHTVNQTANEPAQAQAPAPRGGAAGRPTKQTLGSVFRQSLCQLMDTINKTNVSYIRCIKSNSQKLPFHFEPQMVLSQLRACGVLETIRISTMGFPGRWSFDEFAERYYFLVKSSDWMSATDTRGLCKTVLQAHIPDETRYQLGLTKVFFRAGQLAYLEKLRSEVLNNRVATIQKLARGFLVRRRVKLLRVAVLTVQCRWRGVLARRDMKMRKRTKAALIIQTSFRRHRAQRDFSKLRASVIFVQMARKRVLLSRRLKARRQVRAAKKIQRAFRQYKKRKEANKYMRAIIAVQCRVRRIMARRALKTLRTEARSINHFKEISYKMESKVVELTRNLESSNTLVRSLQEQLKASETQARTWREKFEAMQAGRAKLVEQADKQGALQADLDQLSSTIKGLQSQVNAANETLKTKDTEIASLAEQVAKFKEERRAVVDRDTQHNNNNNGSLSAGPTRLRSNSITTRLMTATPRLSGEPLTADSNSSSGLAKMQINPEAAVEVAKNNALHKEIEDLKRQLDEERKRNAHLASQRGLTASTAALVASIKHPSVELISAISKHEETKKTRDKRKRSSVGNIAAVLDLDLGSVNSLSSGSSKDTKEKGIAASVGRPVDADDDNDVSFNKLRRRHTSVEAWSKQQRLSVEALLITDRSGKTAAASVQALAQRDEEATAILQEHVFNLLQEPDLEWEIVNGLIIDLTVPERPDEEMDIPKRQTVFPAHTVGLYCLKLWQHGLSSKMDRILDVVLLSIVDRITPESVADHTALFWLSNLIEIDAILRSSMEYENSSSSRNNNSPGREATSMASHSNSSARRGSMYMAGEHVLRSMRPKVQSAAKRVYAQWFRSIKRHLDKVIAAAVVEHQPLSGIVTKVNKKPTSVFARLTSSATEQEYSIEQLLEYITKIRRALKFYSIVDEVQRITFNEMFRIIGSVGFNQLILRQSHATWKRGMQIQFNVNRIIEWSRERGLQAESEPHLERLLQASKLLQLTKTRPDNVDQYIADVFDRCGELSPAQISKLLTSYSLADFENPVPPEVLNRIANSAVHDGRNDYFMIPERSDTDFTWFNVPNTLVLDGIEKYIPEELEEGLPRVLLLYKFS